MLDHHTALSTLDYLDQEEDYVPWKAAFRELDYLDRSLQLTPFYGQFIVNLFVLFHEAVLKSYCMYIYYSSSQN